MTLNWRKVLASIVAVTAITLMSATPTRAAILQVNMAGQLTGATGVDVNGTLYDVAFVDGSCVDEFNGCDELSDFAFGGDGATALAAAQALLDQVLIDGLDGNFDSSPDLVFGCELPQSCAIRIPFDFQMGTMMNTFLASVANNTEAGAGLPDAAIPQSTDGVGGVTSAGGALAVFTVSAEIPIPAAAPLLLTGLIGLFAFKMRRRCTR